LVFVPFVAADEHPQFLVCDLDVFFSVDLGPFMIRSRNLTF